MQTCQADQAIRDNAGTARQRELEIRRNALRVPGCEVALLGVGLEEESVPRAERCVHTRPVFFHPVPSHLGHRRIAHDVRTGEERSAVPCCAGDFGIELIEFFRIGSGRRRNHGLEFQCVLSAGGCGCEFASGLIQIDLHRRLGDVLLERLEARELFLVAELHRVSGEGAPQFLAVAVLGKQLILFVDVGIDNDGRADIRFILVKFLRLALFDDDFGIAPEIRGGQRDDAEVGDAVLDHDRLALFSGGRKLLHFLSRDIDLPGRTGFADIEEAEAVLDAFHIVAARDADGAGDGKPAVFSLGDDLLEGLSDPTGRVIGPAGFIEAHADIEGAEVERAGDLLVVPPPLGHGLDADSAGKLGGEAVVLAEIAAAP